jgi:hypothetical protein
VFSLYSPKPMVTTTTHSNFRSRQRGRRRRQKGFAYGGGGDKNTRGGGVPRGSFEGRLTLTDFDDEQLENFVPDTLLICGRSDPLIHGNRQALAKLLRTNHSCRLSEYPGTHAYHGFPPQWTFGEFGLGLCLCLVWFGLVWFGLVWFGLVWFGLVWFGLVWYNLVCVECFDLICWFVCLQWNAELWFQSALPKCVV